MFLTPEELRALTGYRQRAKQLAWLREHRWRAHMNAKGEVCVDRGYYTKRMVGAEDEPLSRAEPNFAALGAR